MTRTLAIALFASTALALPAAAQGGGCAEQAASLSANVQASTMNEQSKTQVLSSIESAAAMNEQACMDRLAEIQQQDLQSGRASTGGGAPGFDATPGGGANSGGNVGTGTGSSN